MDAILARPSRPREPARADVDDLPFAVEDTPDGPLHVRTLRLSGAHRVGRVPVTPARTASSELLAVLALDPKLAACRPQDALYLDTETTGLGAGAGTVAFLVGLSFWDEHTGLVVEQLLVRTLGDERPVLARVRDRLARASMLVTFNGKSFDMPVLRTRFVMSRMPVPVEPPHLDLLHVARRLHKARGVGSRLGAVERAILGFVRENDVPSGEVSACYLHFLRTGDPRALIGVVEHNAWDVVSMAALVGLYGESLQASELAPIDLVGVARTWKRAASVWPRQAGAAREGQPIGPSDDGPRDASPSAASPSATGSPDEAPPDETPPDEAPPDDLNRSAMLAQAYAIADEAHARGADPETLRARAEMAKARGDKVRALADFEALASQIDDPQARLELAKLYEHHVKDLARALEVTERGTAEAEDRRARRRTRLADKLEKAGAAHAKSTLKLW